MKNIHTFLLLPLCLLAYSCSRTEVKPSKPLVTVSIPPQKYFVEKIAGDLVDVLVMIPPGSSPHSYEPKPQQMAALSRSRLYCAIGVEFEKAWLDRLTKNVPGMTVISTDSGIAKIPIADAPGAEAHQGNDHSGLDPHIWLSPELVKHQAALITQALSELVPAHKETFRRNDSLFTLELVALQDSIRHILSDRTPGFPFMVFHPSWGYFAREFNLKQIAIEVDGKEPSPAELKTIFDFAGRMGITTIYAQPQFSRRGVEIISREIGARVVIADPLSAEWETNLIACARVLTRE
jgi:zinc transport system substrate-binding protein